MPAGPAGPSVRSVPAPRRTTAARGWGTAVTAGLAAVGVYAVAVLTPTGQALDDRLMTWAAANAPSTDWARAVLADLVSAPLLLLAVIGVSALALVVHGGARAAAVAGVAVGTMLASQLLKPLLDRPPLLDAAAANSFPSGHVAAVAGLAVALALAVPRLLRPLTVVLGAAAVTVVGAATVVLEWHRPSDVVGSVLVALALGGLAEAFTPGRRRSRRRA